MANRVKTSVLVRMPSTRKGFFKTQRVKIDPDNKHAFAFLMLSPCGKRVVTVWKDDPIPEGTENILGLYSREANGLIDLPCTCLYFNPESRYVDKSPNIRHRVVAGKQGVRLGSSRASLIA